MLRNLDPPNLCNGTTLIVQQLFQHLIIATILTGQGKGKTVYIPRIPMIPTELPFQFKRTQFPVKVSFAMTITKAQGKSLKVVGLNLSQLCFSHGQFYVGCSTVANPNNLFLYTPSGTTKKCCI